MFAVEPVSVDALPLLVVDAFAAEPLEADEELLDDFDEALFDDAEEDDVEEVDAELALEDTVVWAADAGELSLDPDEPGLMTNMASAPTAASAATTPTIGATMLALLLRGVGLKLFGVCWPVPEAVLRVAGFTVWVLPVLPLFAAAPLSFDTCMAPHLMQNTAPSFNS